MVVAALVVLAYVLARRPNNLAGDQLEYFDYGNFFTQGKLFWTSEPFGEAHNSVRRAVGYPTWTGFWYSVLGVNTTRLLIVQSLVLAPLTVLLTWLLARRLFGPRVAIASACVIAVFPLSWELIGLLYPEALAIPLTVLVLLLFLGREPTTVRALGVGAALGALMLVRPTSVFLGAGVAAAWIVGAGWRRGAAMTAFSALAALLVILPWTIRNYVVTDGEFVLLSVQDAALHGTFNDEAANDPLLPYAWRPVLQNDIEIIERGVPVDDITFRDEQQDAAFDYIGEHPFSLVEAFYWNGLSRFWDIRRPGRALDEAPFEGRSRAVTGVGLAMYYVLLPLAIYGLWRLRRRRDLLVPILALALAASIVFTVASGTRYRSTIEPLIVVLACSAVFRREPATSPEPAPSAV